METVAILLRPTAMKRSTRTGLFGAAGYLVLGLIYTQSLLAQPAPLTFEVASLKPSTSGFNGVRGGCRGIDSRPKPEELSGTPLGRCRITDGRLSHLIGIAWDLRSLEYLKGGPDWMMTGAERFNVEAKAEDPTKATEQQLLEMLQALLIERFHMKLHHESQELPGFTLVVAKNGPKLTASKSDKMSTSFGGPLKVKPIPGEPISLTARKHSMRSLAEMLGRIGQGPVVDNTGLTGDYDFELSWDETAGPSLFTALQEQLGLRLV